MISSQIPKTLTQFMDKDNPYRCILIDGQWGIGKSFSVFRAQGFWNCLYLHPETSEKQYPKTCKNICFESERIADILKADRQNERISRKAGKFCKNMSFPRTNSEYAKTKNTVPISVCSEYARSRGQQGAASAAESFDRTSRTG